MPRTRQEATMKTYEVIVREVVVQTYWVEAETAQDAQEHYGDRGPVEQDQVESEVLKVTERTEGGPTA